MRICTKSLLSISLLLIIAFPAFADGPVAPPPPGAHILFPEKIHDFGAVPEGPDLEYTFKFTNFGKDTLKIDHVKTSCGCTAAESSEIVAPGNEGDIKVTYHTKERMGPFKKTIYVFSNDSTNSELALEIIGEVKMAAELKE